MKLITLVTSLILLSNISTITAKDNAQELPYFHDRIYTIQKQSEEQMVQAEIQFGRNLAARILGQYKLSKNKELSQYVATLGTGMAAQMGRPELTYYFGVIESEKINALACPGGYIFITTGALKLMTNEATLAGVLGHEIAHINRKHVIKKIKLNAQDQSAISEFGSIVGASSQTAKILMEKMLDEAFNILFETGLQTDDELEADTDAITMLLALNYDWESYRDLIGSLKKNKNANETISKTHPAPSKRVATMTKFISNLTYNIGKGRYHEKRFTSYTKK